MRSTRVGTGAMVGHTVALASSTKRVDVSSVRPSTVLLSSGCCAGVLVLLLLLLLLLLLVEDNNEDETEEEEEEVEFELELVVVAGGCWRSAGMPEAYSSGCCCSCHASLRVKTIVRHDVGRCRMTGRTSMLDERLLDEEEEEEDKEEDEEDDDNEEDNDDDEEVNEGGCSVSTAVPVVLTECVCADGAGDIRGL